MRTFPRRARRGVFLVLLFLSPLSSRGFSLEPLLLPPPVPPGPGASRTYAWASSPSRATTMMIPRQRSRRILLLHRMNHRETQALLTRGAGGGWQPNEVEGTNDEDDLRSQRRKSTRDDGGPGPGRDRGRGRGEDDANDNNDPFEGEENEAEFLRRELAHLASLEELLSELDIDDDDQDAEEALDDDDFMFGDDDDDVNDDDVEDPVYRSTTTRSTRLCPSLDVLLPTRAAHLPTLVRPRSGPSAPSRRR
jgi:hypothetical protein